MNEEKVCCICGKKFTEWGNNPWPVVTDKDAVCCDMCNSLDVLPARLKMMFNKEDK